MRLSGEQYGYPTMWDGHQFTHNPGGSTMPKWARIAIIGGVLAVATDYFLKPTITKAL